MNIYDISQKAGVSIATVSRVLNNSPHVSEGTKQRVLAVIESSGYVPNAFARGLGLNTMKTIGLLCPDAADPYLAHALAFLERSFRERQYDCLLCCTGRELKARVQGVEMLKSRHVDGIVMMGSTFIEAREKDNRYISEAAASVPVVLLNGSYACDRVYCVVCDDRRATMESVQYLLDAGRRSILYLYHNSNDSGQRKLRGYREALASRGVELREELICFFGDDKMSVPHVRDRLLKLYGEGLRFDAVMASEDTLGIGAVKFAGATGQSVPGDLSVIGYNNSDFCLCSEPELTSVDNKLSAICDQCVATLMGVLEGREMPQKTVFTAELVKRESTL